MSRKKKISVEKNSEWKNTRSKKILGRKNYESKKFCRQKILSRKQFQVEINSVSEKIQGQEKF